MLCQGLVAENMKITSVKINLRDRETLKATVSIILNNCFVMRGIAIVKRRESDDLLVRMPSRRRADDSYRSYFHPINNEVRGAMTEVILDAYRQVLENPQENTIWYDQDEQDPLAVSDVRVSLIRDDQLVKAIASITLEDAIALNQVRVIQYPDSGNVLLSIPARKVVREAAEEGGEDEVHHIEYFHPLTKGCRQVLTDAVMEAYQNKLDEQAAAE